MSTANNDNTVSSPSDENLFNEPPQNEDCPICFLRLPTLDTGSKYNSCCGKIICSGCIYAPVYDNNGNKVKKKCPFCRAVAPTSEEILKRNKNRVEAGDFVAIYSLGGFYFEGRYGLPQDMVKALELWHRAAELSYVSAYCNIGNVYWYGNGVERDAKKATHYYELAAIGGSEHARLNLGVSEVNKGNYGRALKHFMIAAGSGHNNSLKKIKFLYLDGDASKDDYAKALQAYQVYLSEIKSDDRDKAAAYSDNTNITNDSMLVGLVCS